MKYYVDLSNRDANVHAGTQTDPFSWFEFVTKVTTDISYISDTFYLKGNGVHTSATDLYILWFRNLLPWGEKVPWTLTISNPASTLTFVIGTRIEYGIIFATKIEDISTPYKGMFLNTDTLSLSDSEFKGCTLRASTLDIPAFSTEYFENSILDIDTITSNPSSTLELVSCNTNLSKTYILSQMSLSDNASTYEWESPGASYWDALEADEVVGQDLIFSTIVVVPLQNYTGYTLDLFGDTRTGIGAVSNPRIDFLFYQMPGYSTGTFPYNENENILYNQTQIIDEFDQYKFCVPLKDGELPSSVDLSAVSTIIPKNITEAEYNKDVIHRTRNINTTAGCYDINGNYEESVIIEDTVDRYVDAFPVRNYQGNDGSTSLLFHMDQPPFIDKTSNDHDPIVNLPQVENLHTKFTDRAYVVVDCDLSLENGITIDFYIKTNGTTREVAVCGLPITCGSVGNTTYLKVADQIFNVGTIIDWNHVAIEYYLVTPSVMKILAFSNGVKQLDTNITTPTEYNSKQATIGSTLQTWGKQVYLKEFRVSKCIRWEENFIPNIIGSHYDDFGKLGSYKHPMSQYQMEKFLEQHIFKTPFRFNVWGDSTHYATTRLIYETNTWDIKGHVLIQGYQNDGRGLATLSFGGKENAIVFDVQKEKSLKLDKLRIVHYPYLVPTIIKDTYETGEESWDLVTSDYTDRGGEGLEDLENTYADSDANTVRNLLVPLRTALTPVNAESSSTILVLDENDYQGKLIVSNSILDIQIGDLPGSKNATIRYLYARGSQTLAYFALCTFVSDYYSPTFWGSDDGVYFVANIIDMPSYNKTYLFESSTSPVASISSIYRSPITSNKISSYEYKWLFKSVYTDEAIVYREDYFPILREHTIHHHWKYVSETEGAWVEGYALGHEGFLDQLVPFDIGFRMDSSINKDPFLLRDLLSSDIVDFTFTGARNAGAYLIDYNIPTDQVYTISTTSDLNFIISLFSNGAKEIKGLVHVLVAPGVYEINKFIIDEFYTGRHGKIVIEGQYAKVKLTQDAYQHLNTTSIHPIFKATLKFRQGSYDIQIKQIKVLGSITLENALLDSTLHYNNNAIIFENDGTAQAYIDIGQNWNVIAAGNTIIGQQSILPASTSSSADTSSSS